MRGYRPKFQNNRGRIRADISFQSANNNLEFQNDSLPESVFSSNKRIQTFSRGKFPRSYNNRGRIRSDFSSRSKNNTSELHNCSSITESNQERSSLTIEEALKLLDEIVSENSSILHYIYNGNFLNILICASKFDRRNVFQLLSSINKFIEENIKSKSIENLFLIISSSKFVLNNVSNIINECVSDLPQSDEIEILLIFFINYMLQEPKYFDENLKIFYCTILMCSEQFKEMHIQNLRNKYISAFKYMKEFVKNPPQKALVVIEDSKPYDCDTYRSITIVPQSDDIFCLNDEVKLYHNKFDDDNNSYESVDDYLNTQFRLLREDFIRPLRESIAMIRENLRDSHKLTSRNMQVRIYENVVIEDLLPSRNGIVYKIKFDISRFPAKMDWKKSRRFIHGSLLCFTNNYFDSIYFATVIECDPRSLQNGNVMVQFENDPISEILQCNQFMMLETKNLFEAYRHVLSKLQNFDVKTMPFQNYIAFAENVIETPRYMKISDVGKIDCLQENANELDDSQLPALINSLKSNISLIQGPPGTGKTFVGLEIIKYLSYNFQTNNYNIGPILVVCYTNHALDQFLTDIISDLGEEHVIRVGGRSKVEAMKICNINSIKRKWVVKKRFPHWLNKQIIVTKQDIKTKENDLVDLYITIMNLNGRLLTYNELFNHMNINERIYFQRYDFNNWLKGAEILQGNNFIDLNKPCNVVIVDYQLELINECIEESLKTIVEKICNDILLEKNDEIYDNDDEVEDTETFLSNQRFLDEDLEVIKSVKKFELLYNEKRMKNNINKNELIIDYSNEFKTVANLKLIKRKLMKIEPITQENYEKIRNLNLDFNIRLQLYKYWFEKYRIFLISKYQELKTQYDKLNSIRQSLFNEEYQMIMKESKVIGMTTTGAARYGEVLDRLGCKVVVIEEAAEVLETHVICSLSKHCQQLIMIGDHKQLRPKVDVYDLEINYNMGISLFERLIANKCQYFTLQYQHRMRPEISKCVKPIYPDLRDSDSVFNYSSILGMGVDIYFFNHSNFENETNDTSYQNDYEAKFLTEFCRYLLKCGNKPKTITVLTFYTGQLYRLNKFMKSPVFKGIRICVVDNFQGEENDIIILSLVRSNSKGEVGFLKSENRLCVALSRAKRGFYVIGNMIMLCKKIKLLNDIVNKSYSKNIGCKIPLKCSLHPSDNNYFVTDIDDFSKPCPSVCGMMLGCGHSCINQCHVSNPSHKKYRCHKPCLRKCSRLLHNCKLICFMKCKCEEKINLILTCQHKVTISCYIKDELVDCEEKCKIILQCGHECSGKCSANCFCDVIVDFDLACGHVKREICGSKMYELKCYELCNRKLDCGHNCSTKCCDKCICTTMIEFQLPCKHIQKALCKSKLSEIKCRNKIIKEFKCGHKITSECWKKPDKCIEEVNKELRCGHTNRISCSEQNEAIDCVNICGKKLACSHICQSQCNKCFNGRLHQRCQQKCNKLLKCGHRCQSLCHAGHCPLCRAPCKLGCKHEPCQLKCNEICDRRICSSNCTKRIICEKCNKIKKCQRTCDEECSKLCDTCEKIDFHICDYYEMETCKCQIKKSDFDPKTYFTLNNLNFKCQICDVDLLLPYRGFYLKHYNACLSKNLQSLPTNEFDKLVKLFEIIKDHNILDKSILDEILLNVKEMQIFQCDFKIFETSYKCYEEILDVYSILLTVKENVKLKIYFDKVIEFLIALIKWLDPTIRRYETQETRTYNSEMNFIKLIVSILQFINCASLSDYALIFQNSFSLLNEMQTFFGALRIENFERKFFEIKAIVRKNVNVSKEEEEIVEKVNNAKDLLKDFNLNNKPLEEKLKLVKMLIKKCHPDKNKSVNSANAFRKLHALKETLKTRVL